MKNRDRLALKQLEKIAEMQVKSNRQLIDLEVADPCINHLEELSMLCAQRDEWNFVRRLIHSYLEYDVLPFNNSLFL